MPVVFTPVASTGTIIEDCMAWLRTEIDRREWGTVNVNFTICARQITQIKRSATDTDKIQMVKVDK